MSNQTSGPLRASLGELLEGVAERKRQALEPLPPRPPECPVCRCWRPRADEIRHDDGHATGCALQGGGRP